MIKRWLIIQFSVCALFLNVQANSHVVRAGQSLQAAINKARPGDTLVIGRGLYRQGTIIINKQLTLQGEGYPVFDGQHKNEVFIVTAPHVILDGLQVQNTGRSSLVDMAGIKLQNVMHVTVRRCRIYNTTYGVYLQNSRDCTIEGNEIKASALDELQSGNGVHAWKCERLLIRNNSLSGHRDGIYFEFVTGSLIEANRSFNNIRYGLHFMFSHNDTYRGNTFESNGAGVAVMYTKGVVMEGNTFFHNWGDAAYGILLKDISDSRIEHNRFYKNTVGIFMEGSSRLTVSRNDFNGNGWAMRIQASCEKNTFSTNNFLGNSFDVTTNGSLMLNDFTGNFWDKYEGYDLDRDGIGDVPHYPVSLYSVITEKMPAAMILYRSILTGILDQAEKVLPSVTPDHLKDDKPRTKKWTL